MPRVAGCEKAGMRSIKDVYAPDVEQSVVLARIAELNADPAVHGILVQLPLPKHFDSEAVLESISPEKDVDGFHAENVGALMQGNPRFIPCTPYGVMKMLESANVPLKGAEVVIVGRSNIVGKPLAAVPCIHEVGERQLPEVVLAGGASRTPDGRPGRHEHRHQNCDDGNDHQKFDQGEAGGGANVCSSFHDLWRASYPSYWCQRRQFTLL